MSSTLSQSNLFQFFVLAEKLFILNDCTREVLFCSSNKFDRKYEDLYLYFKKKIPDLTYRKFFDDIDYKCSLVKASYAPKDTKILSTVSKSGLAPLGSMIMKGRIGNCRTMSLFAKFLFDSCFPDPSDSAEVRSIRNQDHAFIIINHSIVWDPWANEVYPLHEIIDKMHMYTRCYFNASTGKPVTGLVSLSMTYKPTLDPPPYCLVSADFLWFVQNNLQTEIDTLHGEVQQITTDLGLRPVGQVVKAAFRKIRSLDRQAGQNDSGLRNRFYVFCKTLELMQPTLSLSDNYDTPEDSRIGS